MKQRIVVSAACITYGVVGDKFGHGHNVLLCSARHWDQSMDDQLKVLEIIGLGISSTRFDQGFIDQHGVYMDREEAMVVAKAAGQVSEDYVGISATKLDSEGLY